jgi:hypothetical protein
LPIVLVTLAGALVVLLILTVAPPGSINDNRTETAALVVFVVCPVLVAALSEPGWFVPVAVGLL